MLSPADEVLEKLEQSSIELVDIQRRLAKKMFAMMKRNQQQQESSSSSSLFITEEEKNELLRKTTERLLQCFFVGFNHREQDRFVTPQYQQNKNTKKSTSIDALLDMNAWNEIVEQRNNKSNEHFCVAMDFFEKSISERLTQPFVIGASHLAFGGVPTTTTTTTTTHEPTTTDSVEEVEQEKEVKQQQQEEIKSEVVAEEKKSNTTTNKKTNSSKKTSSKKKSKN